MELNTVEFGSLRKAAAAQGVTPQAASKALAQLEENLGVRLLHRTTRGLSLTDEGQRLLDATRPALAALDHALQRARSSREGVAGPLRIIGPRSSFAPVLWAVLRQFADEHPEVQPEVHLDDGIGDWVMDRVDVGFRFGASPQEGLIARPLLAVQLIICAAPSYLERYGMPTSLDDLASHRCSVFRHPTTGQIFPWYLNEGGEITQRQFPPTLVSNDTDLELQAALSGNVVAQLSSLTVTPLIRDGRLVPVLTQHVSNHLHLYAYYGSRKAQPLRVRKFLDLAVEVLVNSQQFVLTPKELARAETKARKLHGS